MVVGFGYSAGDIILCIKLVVEAYQRWESACGERADIIGRLGRLKDLLENVERYERAILAVDARGEQLKGYLVASELTISKLQTLLDAFPKLTVEGPGSLGKNWQTLRYTRKATEIATLQSRLDNHISDLTSFCTTIGIASLSRVETRQDVHTQYHQQHQRELGLILRHVLEIHAKDSANKESVVSAWTDYTDDDLNAWRDLRSELRNSGFDGKTIDQHRDMITKMLGQPGSDNAATMVTDYSQAFVLDGYRDPGNVIELSRLQVASDTTRPVGDTPRPDNMTGFQPTIPQTGVQHKILPCIPELDVDGEDDGRGSSVDAVKPNTVNDMSLPDDDAQLGAHGSKPRAISFNTQRPLFATYRLRNSASDTDLAVVPAPASIEAATSVLRDAPHWWTSVFGRLMRFRKPSSSLSAPVSEAKPRFKQGSAQSSLDSPLCETVLKVGDRVSHNEPCLFVEIPGTDHVVDDSDVSQWSMQATASSSKRERDKRRHSPCAGPRHFEPGFADPTSWDARQRMPDSAKSTYTSPTSPHAGFLPQFDTNTKRYRAATSHKAPKV